RSARARRAGTAPAARCGPPRTSWTSPTAPCTPAPPPPAAPGPWRAAPEGAGPPTRPAAHAVARAWRPGPARLLPVQSRQQSSPEPLPLLGPQGQVRAQQSDLGPEPRQAAIWGSRLGFLILPQPAEGTSPLLLALLGEQQPPLGPLRHGLYPGDAAGEVR